MIDGLDEVIDRAQRLEKSAGADAGREFLIDEFTSKGITPGLAKGLADDALSGHQSEVSSVLEKAVGDEPWSDISFVHGFGKDVHPGGGQHGHNHDQMVSTQTDSMATEEAVTPQGGASQAPLTQHAEKHTPAFPIQEAAEAPQDMIELAHWIRKMEKADGCPCCGSSVAECECSADCRGCNCKGVEKALNEINLTFDESVQQHIYETLQKAVEWGGEGDGTEQSDADSFPTDGSDPGDSVTKQDDEPSDDDPTDDESEVGEEEDEEDEPDEPEPSTAVEEPDPAEPEEIEPAEAEPTMDEMGAPQEIEELNASINELVGLLRDMTQHKGEVEELGMGDEAHVDRTDPVTQDLEDQMARELVGAEIEEPDASPLDDMVEGEQTPPEMETAVKFEESIQKTRYNQLDEQRKAHKEAEQIEKAFEDTRVMEKMQQVGNAQGAQPSSEELVEDRTEEPEDDSDLHKEERRPNVPFGASVRGRGV